MDEVVIRLTHTQTISNLLPGLAPTGPKASVAVVVIVGLRDDKMDDEHIDWDQASLLAPLGVIDPTRLPIASDAAETLVRWTQSEGAVTA